MISNLNPSHRLQSVILLSAHLVQVNAASINSDKHIDGLSDDEWKVNDDGSLSINQSDGSIYFIPKHEIVSFTFIPRKEKLVPSIEKAIESKKAR